MSNQEWGRGMPVVFHGPVFNAVAVVAGIALVLLGLFATGPLAWMVVPCFMILSLRIMAIQSLDEDRPS